MEPEYKYIVCTWCFTYNHEHYINDALNGFVMQQTDFPVVYCIVDDASTDNNSSVIKGYLNANFDLKENNIAYAKETDYAFVSFARHKTNKNCFFVVLLLKENHKSQHKSKEPYLQEWMNAAKYLAICEGDDYWVDPQKLKKQVDFMDSHPECSLCFHASETLYPDGLRLVKRPKTVKTYYTTEDVILEGGGMMATNSMFYRREFRECKKPDFWKNSPVGDLPTRLFLSLKGLFGYIDEVMSVYRILASGSWSSKQNGSKKLRKAHYKAILRMFDEYDRYTDYKYHRVIQKKKNINRWNYIKSLIMDCKGRITKMFNE